MLKEILQTQSWGVLSFSHRHRNISTCIDCICIFDEIHGFLWSCAHLNRPEWHAAVRWAAWGGHGSGYPGLADVAGVCDAAGADGKEATRLPRVCSLELLHTKNHNRNKRNNVNLQCFFVLWGVSDLFIALFTCHWWYSFLFSCLSPWQRARYISSLSCGTVVLPGAVSFLSHKACASLEHSLTSW